ncbi:helix-hairpin-helix domain-containing protein [Qipengyuania qiaonensis]|uniref:Helix-hairpin-helix domain-containing protein n=1 Tax=Qipengyuania qiaonensis TaxID=2867240 RepID=A0ABS7JCS5_9SPHN|nr:helix-hairpin-helix domain-containing protein [Qipengyuania qiaonensis]MBX7483478.1 helix-hairpin-helix domain-containing protein [Qipengyuania qiaonensis]
MRRMILAATLSSAVLVLAACSGGAEEAAEKPDMVEASDAAAEDTAAEASTVLDANTATAEQLAGAEGVTPELAEAIVAGQPYASVTDLNAKLVETLSDEEAANVLVNVFVPVNLNTGTEEEIRLIPGMTDKMVHEFEEYRPYADISVFDREIGKYVDEAEVARFRSYVTL